MPALMLGTWGRRALGQGAAVATPGVRGELRPALPEAPALQRFPGG